MREYPDYPDEWSDHDHPQAEFWKTDPAYWQAELDYYTAKYAEVEKDRGVWLQEWFATHTGDMMGENAYLHLRVTGEVCRGQILSALLHLHQIGVPEQSPWETGVLR